LPSEAFKSIVCNRNSYIVMYAFIIHACMSNNTYF
jgi:hypothetical protein